MARGGSSIAKMDGVFNPDEQTAFPFKIGEIERVSMPKSSVPIGKTGQATSPK